MSLHFVWPFTEFPHQGSVNEIKDWFISTCTNYNFEAFVWSVQTGQWNRLNKLVQEIVNFSTGTERDLRDLIRRHLENNDLGRAGQGRVSLGEKNKVANDIFEDLRSSKPYAQPTSEAYGSYNLWVLEALNKCAQREATLMKKNEAGRRSSTKARNDILQKGEFR